ncbi:MAG: tetratricopeptide repeat protein [Rhodospirillales bacterium]|nr:tetratricopeptide repeat protein [Rhodospirillales bacterium]
MAGREPFEQTFNKAVQFFEKGKLKKARKCLTDIQRHQPDILDVLHLLSLVELKSDNPAKAIGYLQKAVKLAPRSADLFGLLGATLIKAGRLEDALAALETAVAIDPGKADAQYNLGNTLKDMGHNAQAAERYRRAVAAEPGFTDAHFNLGRVLKADGNLEEAAEAFREAARSNPNDAEAQMALGNTLGDLKDSEGALAALERAAQINPGLATAHYNLGNALGNTERTGDAVAAYQRAVDCDPDFADAHNNLGEALLDQNHIERAITHFNRANALGPVRAEICNNLGNAFRKLGDYDAALNHYDHSLDIDPTFVNAHTNKANALGEVGRWDEALACHRRAVEIDASHAVAHHNLSLQLLLLGQMREGWEEYEWRWRTGLVLNKREFPQTLWRGEDVAGKTVLVWGEQGAGDEILFAGMIPALLELGARVILECDARLAPVFKRSFPGVTPIARATPPDPRCLTPGIDFQIAAGSLGRWLRTAASRPGPIAYLAADKQRSGALKQRYKGAKGVRLVGITWNSVNKQVGDKKSLPLAALAPLAGIDGIVLVDLQYGDTKAERDAFTTATGTEIVHDDTIYQMTDLDAFAAQVAAMDMVITVSNTTAHFSGALGVPTWVMLHPAPLPCWLLEREDSPWYPSVKLFRQVRPGDWSDVVSRVALELGTLNNA